MMYLPLVITSLLLFQWVPAAFAADVTSFTACPLKSTPKCFDRSTNNRACSLSYIFPRSPNSTIFSVNGDILAAFDSIVSVSSLLPAAAAVLNDCPNLSTASDFEIAKRICFLIYDKYGCGPRIVNGTQMINRMCPLIFEDPNAPIVIMMPGFKSFCPNIKAFADNATWTTDTAPQIAKAKKAYVIVVDWGVGGLSCCNYIQIIFCNLDVISRFLTRVIRNCFANKISTMWLIGHSLGARALSYAAKNLHTPVGKYIALDAAGPGWSTSCSPLGKCSAISQSIARSVVVVHSAPGTLGTAQIYTPCSESRFPCVVDIQVKNGISYCWNLCTRLPNASMICTPGCAHDTSAYAFFPQWVLNRKVYASSGPQRSLFLYDNSKVGSYILQQSNYLGNSDNQNIRQTKSVCKSKY